VRSVRPAYTLLEIVLVLVLLVVLSAMALPAISSLQAGPRLNAAADLVHGRLNDARTRAIDERRGYRFAINEHTGAFKIAPDTTDYWDDASNAFPSAGKDATDWVVEEALPDKVAFGRGEGSTAGSDGWQTVVTFRPDGTASDDVAVTLQSQGAGSTTIRVGAATGAIHAAGPAEAAAHP
jgi:Tfp pilus assembly protein FimT